MQQQIYFIKKKKIDATLRFRFQRGLHERERERGEKKQKKKNKLESTTQKILKVYRQINDETLQQWLSRFPSMCESRRKAEVAGRLW